jgi:hypothetical protein
MARRPFSRRFYGSADWLRQKSEDEVNRRKWRAELEQQEKERQAVEARRNYAETQEPHFRALLAKLPARWKL